MDLNSCFLFSVRMLGELVLNISDIEIDVKCWGSSDLSSSDEDFLTRSKVINWCEKWILWLMWCDLWHNIGSQGPSKLEMECENLGYWQYDELKR